MRIPRVIQVFLFLRHTNLRCGVDEQSVGKFLGGQRNE